MHQTPVAPRVSSRALSLLTLPLLAACGSVYAERQAEYEHALTYTGALTIDVQSDNGRISVESAPGSRSLKLLADMRAQGEDMAIAEARVAEFDVQIEELENGLVRIRPVFSGERRGSDAIGLSIQVPELGTLQAKTHNGRILVAGAQHLTNAETHNGRIEASRCQGPITLTTSNGRVSVQDSNGHLRVRTNNGRVKVENHTGVVDVETDNGRVDLVLADASTEPFLVKTDNGRIHLVAPASWRGRVDASTDNGRVHFKHQGETKSRVRGATQLTLGEGQLQADASPSRLETDNGSITVEQK